VIFTILTVQI